MYIYMYKPYGRTWPGFVYVCIATCACDRCVPTGPAVLPTAAEDWWMLAFFIYHVS